MLPLIPYCEVHPVSASASQAYPIRSHTCLLLSKLLPFVIQFFLLSEHFLLSFLSFFLYLHQVFIHCSSLSFDVCRRHVKCFQDFFLRGRNRIIHALSPVALADQFYFFQFPDCCRNRHIVFLPTLLHLFL